MKENVFYGNSCIYTQSYCPKLLLKVNFCTCFFLGLQCPTQTKPETPLIALVVVGLYNTLSLMWEAELPHNSTFPNLCSLSNSQPKWGCPTGVIPALSQAILHFCFADFVTSTWCKATCLNWRSNTPHIYFSQSFCSVLFTSSL